MELKPNPADLILSGNDAGVASYTFPSRRPTAAIAWQKNWKPSGLRSVIVATNS
jgi:hypothetical protein